MPLHIRSIPTSTLLMVLMGSAAILECSSDESPSTSGASAGTPSKAGAGPASGAGGSEVPGSGGRAGNSGPDGQEGGTAGRGGTAGGSFEDRGLVGGGGFLIAGLGGAGAFAGDTGAGGSGSAGAMDTASGDESAATVLNHYQLLDPCDLSKYKIEPSPAAVCPQINAVKNQHVSVQFGGDPSVIYAVTLRVRAIMEHYWFTGGTLDPASKSFYCGGVPTVGGYSSACKNKANELPFKLPAELTPTDNCFNGFNVFALAISEPRSHYYLNYTADKNGDRPPHAVYGDDYTVTLPIKGRAMLDFYIIGSDEHECYNHDQVVTGVALPQSPYIGQFVQFDVIKVVRSP